MRRAAVQPIFQRARVKRFSWDVELLYVAMKLNIPIEEVPVTWRNAEGIGKVLSLQYSLPLVRKLALVLELVLFDTAFQIGAVSYPLKVEHRRSRLIEHRKTGLAGGKTQVGILVVGGHKARIEAAQL